jgi:hypothetical protein
MASVGEPERGNEVMPRHRSASTRVPATRGLRCARRHSARESLGESERPRIPLTHGRGTEGGKPLFPQLRGAHPRASSGRASLGREGCEHRSEPADARRVEDAKTGQREGLTR